MINWTPTCCAWHGDYAEVKTKDGGVARLKRSPDIEGIMVMRFDEKNRRVDDDYVNLSESEVMALVA